jgi:RimJ/RimL family protein N-acetyltransferase
MIETNRLILRKMNHDDFDEVADMLRDKAVMYAWEHTFSDEEITAWINKRMNGYEKYGYDYFLAINKATKNAVGQIGLLDEEINGRHCTGIGYILKKEHWGNGYATEGAKACLEYAFKVLKAKKVICDIRPENKNSIAVARRLGMIKTGEFIKNYNGKEMLHFIFELNNKL